jgi:hypothetical protein
MANNSEEGQGSQKAVVPVMMMMMMITVRNLIKQQHHESNIISTFYKACVRIYSDNLSPTILDTSVNILELQELEIYKITTTEANVNVEGVSSLTIQ